MNNNPCQLSKILENVPGEDLDGDGQVTEQEIIETRVKKGKEIFARTFIKENVCRCIFSMKSRKAEKIMPAL